MQKLGARHAQEWSDQTTGQARKGSGDDESHKPIRPHVQPGEGYPLGILTDCLEDHAKRTAADQVKHDRGDGHNTQHHMVIDRGIRQSEVKPQPEGAQGKPGEAVTAVGHRAPLVGDSKDHHAKSQGQHGKVHLIEADAQEADHQSQ